MLVIRPDGGLAVACARCKRPAPIDPEDELFGDGGGDPELLPVLAPPEGWLPDPDDEDRIICRPCSTPAELEEWDEVLAGLDPVDDDDDFDPGSLWIA